MDQATADAAIAILRQLTKLGGQAGLQAVGEALRADDASLLDLGPVALAKTSSFILWFLNERGIPAPDVVLEYAESRLVGADTIDASIVEVARAIWDRDPEQLAAAIDKVDKHGRVPDAARLRIVLAEMTGNPAPLEQARPVFERLEDRQFVRRLEEVASSLR